MLGCHESVTSHTMAVVRQSLAERISTHVRSIWIVNHQNFVFVKVGAQKHSCQKCSQDSQASYEDPLNRHSLTNHCVN